MQSHHDSVIEWLQGQSYFCYSMHYTDCSKIYLKGANSTIRLVCPCGFTALCNMSGGASEGNQFDQLVNQNLLLSSITPKKMTDFCVGINMKARNYQGNMIGVNLEHQHMTRMRNELYCEVIQKKVELEDQMLQQVLENEIPEFSTDAFYSHM